MKYKLLLTVVSLYLGVAFCFAQNTLNVHQKDGTVVSYAFSEKPEVTYTDTGIHLVTTKLEVDFPMASLEMFTFSTGEATAIETVRTENTSDDVRIYNTNGMLLKTIHQTDGVVKYSISDLPQGIYIIKNGITTYKITKR